MTSLKRTAVVTAFSVAMAFLETAVVIYLRTLYYPKGFDFPLARIDPSILTVEVLREIATLFMLVCVGIFNGRDRSEKLAWFIYSFAVWDIFYYAFLKLFLGWPPSLLSWDILFLIPILWVGPVLAPLILSVMMIMLASIIIYFTEKRGRATIVWADWALLIAGSIVVVVGFCWDFISYLHTRSDLWEMVKAGRTSELASHYVPRHFEWRIFLTGVVVLSYVIGRIIVRNRR
jgi:hypothetical protein